MKKDYKELDAKLDKIIKIQELILSKLEQSILIPNTVHVPKKESKRNQEKAELQSQIKQNLIQSLKLKPHKRMLQVKYNLSVPPSEKRVLEYLKTQDPEVFNGLLRNN